MKLHRPPPVNALDSRTGQVAASGRLAVEVPAGVQNAASACLAAAQMLLPRRLITARDYLPPRRALNSRERCRILAARSTVGSVRKRAQNAYPAWLGRGPTWVDVQPDGRKPDVSRQPWIPGDKDPFATGAIRSAAQAFL